MLRRIIYITSFTILWSMGSCTRNDSDTIITDVVPDAPSRPAHFPETYYKHTPNTYSKAGFELGRKLFFDPMLSIDNTISCGSCHKQQHAFADIPVAFSSGINGLKGRRHTPAIFNMAWNKSFMWDGGVNHLEVMPLAPLTNPVEMGESISHIVYKLNRHKDYPALFKKVFNRDSIDDQQMFWALAQYMSNLVSATSKYDDVYTGKTSFSQDEQEGYILFKNNCAACHAEPLLTDYSFRNNGIDTVYTADSGRYRVSQQPQDWGAFKVPTLRNIAVTAPYMHDGRFTTLQLVLQHYATGVKSSLTVSPLLIKDGNPGLQLSTEDQQKIIAFLQTLTDYKFLSQEGLSE